LFDNEIHKKIKKLPGQGTLKRGNTWDWGMCRWNDEKKDFRLDSPENGGKTNKQGHGIEGGKGSNEN